MAAAAAVDNIHNSIRTLSQTKRIRVTEFFQDFDKLRSGFVTGKSTVLMVCGYLIRATMQNNRSFVFPTRSDTNHPVPSQKKVKGLKFWM